MLVVGWFWSSELHTIAKGISLYLVLIIRGLSLYIGSWALWLPVVSQWWIFFLKLGIFPSGMFSISRYLPGIWQIYLDTTWSCKFSLHKRCQHGKCWFCIEMIDSFIFQDRYGISEMTDTANVFLFSECFRMITMWFLCHFRCRVWIPSGRPIRMIPVVGGEWTWQRSIWTLRGRTLRPQVPHTKHGPIR